MNPSGLAVGSAVQCLGRKAQPLTRSSRGRNGHITAPPHRNSGPAGTCHVCALVAWVRDRAFRHMSTIHVR